MPVATDFFETPKNQSLDSSLSPLAASLMPAVSCVLTRQPLSRSVRMISYSAAIVSLQLSSVALAQTPALISEVNTISEAQNPAPDQQTAESADQADITPTQSASNPAALETIELNAETNDSAAVASSKIAPQEGDNTEDPLTRDDAGLMSADTVDTEQASASSRLPTGDADTQNLNQESQEDPEAQNRGIDPGLYLPELSETDSAAETPTPVDVEKTPFYKRIYNRFFGDEIGDVDYISVETKINQTEQIYPDLALELLASNVEEALIQVTEEDLALGKSIFPRLRKLAGEAAKAVGFYEARFNFQIIDSGDLFVIIDAGAPVFITRSNIDAGSEANENKDIKRIITNDQLQVGKIFNHGFYSSTKASLIKSLENNGFFEKKPILTEVEIVLPDNTADVDLSFDSGPRYEFGEVSFVNTEGQDYTKNNLPNQVELKESVLKQLVTFQTGDKFTQAQLDQFSSNLLNTKYFNGVDLQILKPRAGSDDLTSTVIEPEETAREGEADSNQGLDENVLAATDLPADNLDSSTQVSEKQSSENQKVVDALRDPTANLELSDLDTYSKKLERSLTPADLQRPVVVVLDSSAPNSAEVGLGYGTDTGVRARGQYNQNLLNSRGHSATANAELSQVNQRIELGYRVPLSSPITDTIKFTVGYEHENLSRGTKDLDVTTDTYVLGINRDLFKNDWRHTPSVFYRLYQLDSKIDQIDQDLLPNRFRASLGNQNQEALLFGYRLERSDYQGGLSPYQGFKRYVQAEVGSKSLLTDVNMAILRGGVAGLYSFGTLNDHQILTRFDVGAIFTPSFQDVPYKLRFFTGGDRSIRGFDYQSLSPEVGGYLYGGETLGVGSVEYNYRFKPKIRGALFADAGNAYGAGFKGDTELGMGFGVRYDSPVGPLRVDIAAGVSDPDLPIRLHFFIGPPL